MKMVSELTARHFDEIILDDFFFMNSKNDSDIAAKADKSWTQFRLSHLRVESFRDEEVSVTVCRTGESSQTRNLTTGATLDGEKPLPASRGGCHLERHGPSSASR